MVEAKELIQINNEKRKQLKKENLEYYEDMLVYIRLSYDTSEQEMEEVLSELLDHLLQAQKDGKTAQVVFDNEPKQYADEIIGALPKMVTKGRLKFFSMAILYFFASIAIFSAIFTVMGYFIFDINSLVQEVLLGSLTVKTVLSVPIAFLLLYAVIQYLRWSCFKKINKILEFLMFWSYSILSIGIFMGLLYIIPDIGPVFGIPFYVTALLGLLLYFAASVMRKSI